MRDLGTSIDVGINNLRSARADAVKSFVSDVERTGTVLGTVRSNLKNLQLQAEQIETIDFLIDRLQKHKDELRPSRHTRGIAAPQVLERL